MEHAVEIIHSPAHQDLALRAAREGIVLLKNDNNLLPLKKHLKTIAVIGPNAERNQLGDYTAQVIPQHIVSVLEGIQAKAGSETKVVAVRGCGVLGNDKSGFAEAVRAAKSADVAILVVGESQRRHEHEAGEQEPPSDGKVMMSSAST